VSDQQGFESTLAELEKRVRDLESGDVPLDKALELYEQGVELARTASAHLDAAEQRVAALSRSRDGVEETPLEDG
jgi:exodeoxyribonuclease VII small subunit